MTTPLEPVRFSRLKWIGRSPAHYRHYLDHPAEPSKSMRLGSAVDALLFNTQPIAVSECATRRAKAWDVFAAQNPDSILLTPSENELACGMAESLGRHKQAMDLLSGGERQKRLDWQMNGRDCSGTPDRFSAEWKVDLKTTVSSQPEQFAWHVRKLSYNAQADWYREGVQQNYLYPAPKEYLVAVENTAPFVVTVFELTEQALLAGRKLWRLWFERLLVCEQNDCWPGYVETVSPLDVPDSEGITLTIGGEEIEVE
jgi:hypothetical protein